MPVLRFGKTTLAAFALVLLVGLTAERGSAQLIHFGGQASYLLQDLASVDDGAREDVGGTAGIGVTLAAGPPLIGIEFQASGDVYFPDCGGGDCSYWGGSASVIYRLPSAGAFRLFGGGGLVWRRLSIEDEDDSTSGYQVRLGAELGRTPIIRPYAEFRFEGFGDDTGLENQAIILIGIIF